MTPEEWQEFLEFREFKRQMEERARKPAISADGPDLTISQGWDLYRPTAERRKSYKTVMRCHFMHIIRLLGSTLIRELDYEKGDEYQRLRLAERRLVPDGKGGMRPGDRNVQPATINNEMNSLRAMLNWLVKRRKILANPLTGHQDLEVEHKRRFACTEDDFMKILAHVPPIGRLMFVLAYETGMRRDEFRLLEWQEVNLQGDPASITLPAHRVKGGKKGRTIVLSKLAVEVIKNAPRVTPSKYVFPNPHKNDGGPIPKGTLYTQFVTAREAAGVKGPGDQNYWIHSLRKSYGTNKAISGMPIYMLMEQMGHSSHDVHREYTELSPDHLKGVTKFLDLGPPRKGPRSIEDVERDRKTAEDALREFIRKKT